MSPKNERAFVAAGAAPSAPAITPLRLALDFVGPGRKLVDGTPSLAEHRPLTRRLLEKLADPALTAP